MLLNNRLNKSQRQRIMMFVHSEVTETAEELEDIAKTLKKNNVHVDIVCFGEGCHTNNLKLLEILVAKNRANNRLVVVNPADSFTNAVRENFIPKYLKK